MSIKINVSRFNKETDTEPYLESYEIEKTPGMTIVEALDTINLKYDEDISFRVSCRAGQCGSCGIKLNGKGALACKEEINDGDVIEPLDFPIIKDLIVDKTEVENKVRDLNLHLDCEENKDKFYSNIKNSEFKDTKKVRSCIECHSCLSSCPVVEKFKKDFAGPYYMRYLSKFDFDPRDHEDRFKELLDEGMYSCTSCGICGEVCPKNINTYGDALEKLRATAFEKGLGPLKEHEKMKDLVVETGRTVSKKEKGFIEDVNEDKNKIDKDSKIALFTGCLIDNRLQNVGHALLDVFKANGIDIDVPEGQVCCGSPLIKTGQKDIIPELVAKNKEVFKDYDTIITACAGCGATLKNDYPKYGVNFNVMDISEFLLDKLDTSKMDDLNIKVTWHDPCHLARSQGIKENPRELLKKIKGAEYIEMEDASQCCGAGGGVKSGKPEIALKLAKDKARMIKDTGADVVVTICPFCQYNIQDGLDSENIDVKAMNILELLKMAYDKDLKKS